MDLIESVLAFAHLLCYAFRWLVAYVLSTVICLPCAVTAGLCSII